MKISKLKVKNFKSIENLEVTLNKNEFNDVNLLIGSNASGKSNFIHIFEFLKALKQFGFQNENFYKNFKVQNLKNFNTGTNTVSIEIEMKYDEKVFIRELDSENEVFKVREKIDFKLDLFVQKTDFKIYEKIDFYEHYILVNKKSNDARHLSSTLIYGIEHNDDKFKLTTNQDRIEKYFKPNEIDFQIISPYPVHYLETLSQGFKNQTLLKFSGLLIPDDFFEFGIFDINSNKAKESYDDIFTELLEKDASNLTPVINQILKKNDAIAEQLIADIAGSLNFIEAIKVENFNEQLKLEVKEIWNKNSTDGHLLSDGTINIIALIVILYYQKHDIIFIEEPEKGIHPSLISNLVGIFYDVAKCKNKQIFITSHNEEILKNIYQENGLKDIFLINRNEKGFSIIEKPETKERVKEFLQNDLGIDVLYINNLLTD